MMRCAECDCKHGDACCTWIKSNRPCPECAKAEQLAEAILQAAGSSLRHYTATSRAAILAAAERCIEDIELNAICDEREGDKGIPVGLGTLHGIGGRDE